MSSVADVLTGIAIGSGDPVVGLMVAPARGGYPDADKAKARTGAFFNDQFRIASLPIRGRYEEFGYMKPDKDQLGVRLALEMTGTKKFRELQEKVGDFGDDGGVPILNDNMMARIAKKEWHPEKRVLGFAYMHPGSWERLIGFHPPEVQDRPAEVATVAAAMREVIRVVRGPERSDRSVYSAISLLDLEASGYDLGGGRIELPRLSAVFAGMEDALYDREFTQWLTSKSGMLGLRAAENGDGSLPHLEELLTHVSDTMAFANAMGWHNRTLAPSALAVRDRDRTHTLETALLAMEQASGPLLEAIGENDPDFPAAGRMAAFLERLEAFRVRVQGDFVAAIEGNYDHPAP